MTEQQLLNQNPLALIIEDDREQVSIFSRALQMANFETEIILDGKMAQSRLSETAPAVVVLDLHLPHVSGKELLTQIRGDTRLADTRVIIATADPSTAEMLREEAHLVLIKPISFIQLRDLASRLRPPDTLLPVEE